MTHVFSRVLTTASTLVLLVVGTSCSAPVVNFAKCGMIAKWPDAPITLEWEQVDGASSYSVEVDCLNCRNQPVTPPVPWFSTSGTPWQVRDGLGLSWVTDVPKTVRSEGGRAMRWRVWGVSREGVEGPKTEWCVLPFSDSGLPTPGAPIPE